MLPKKWWRRIAFLADPPPKFLPNEVAVCESCHAVEYLFDIQNGVGGAIADESL
jgi:hypothetical protein